MSSRGYEIKWYFFGERAWDKKTRRKMNCSFVSETYGLPSHIWVDFEEFEVELVLDTYPFFLFVTLHQPTFHLRTWNNNPGDIIKMWLFQIVFNGSRKKGTRTYVLMPSENLCSNRTAHYAEIPLFQQLKPNQADFCFGM